MKCKKENCPREAARGQVYCSREHAPYSYLQGENDNTGLKRGRSARTTSSSVVPGEPSEPSKIDESNPESETLEFKPIRNSGKDGGLNNKNILIQTETSFTSQPRTDTCEQPRQDAESLPQDEWHSGDETLNTQGKSGESGTSETKNNTALTKFEGDSLEIQLTGSFLTSDDASKAKSTSMNLLDSSLSELHDLMKNVGVDAENPTVRRRDPDVVNSACNCAKQIYSLMRLKVDIFKEVRKGK